VRQTGILPETRRRLLHGRNPSNRTSPQSPSTRDEVRRRRSRVPLEFSRSLNALVPGREAVGEVAGDSMLDKMRRDDRSISAGRFLKGDPAPV